MKHMFKRLFHNRKSSPPSRFTADDPQYSGYEIGRWTYGHPEVRRWAQNGHLSIGRFCSLAPGVKIFLGGEHRTDWVTTYPFAELGEGLADRPLIGATKGDVEIGNDVWIGEDALILSGVRIANGAVVGARSTVTRDVPPYAIVAGNPARFIRYRVPEHLIPKLLEIEWWFWPDKIIKENLDLLLSPDVEQFVTKARSLMKHLKEACA